MEKDLDSKGTYKEFFSQLLRTPRLIKDERVFDVNFHVEILHRNNVISELMVQYWNLIDNPGVHSINQFVYGDTGVGKTATVRLFSDILLNEASKRDVPLECIYINCRKEKTNYKVLTKILQTFNKKFPKRGFSPQDLVDALSDFLNTQEIYLLIILDEINYLSSNYEDLIYSLTRINDDLENFQRRIYLICIVNNKSFLNSLDMSIRSLFQMNGIVMRKYSFSQIFDILKLRVDKGLLSNIITNNLIEYISEITLEVGDIRYGINLLWNAAKIAESRNLHQITEECIKFVDGKILNIKTQDILNQLSNEKLVLLLSIIRDIRGSKSANTSLLDAYNRYSILSKNIGLDVRSYSHVWHYIQDLKREQLVIVNVESEKIKGRKTIIKTTDNVLSLNEDYILDILKTRGISM